MLETPFQQAERHVRENAARLDGQRQLVAELERDQHTAEANRARNLRAAFEECQLLALAHAARLRAKSADPPQA